MNLHRQGAGCSCVLEHNTRGIFLENQETSTSQREAAPPSLSEYRALGFTFTGCAHSLSNLAHHHDLPANPSNANGHVGGVVKKNTHTHWPFHAPHERNRKALASVPLPPFTTQSPSGQQHCERRNPTARSAPSPPSLTEPIPAFEPPCLASFCRPPPPLFKSPHCPSIVFGSFTWLRTAHCAS